MCADNNKNRRIALVVKDGAIIAGNINAAATWKNSVYGMVIKNLRESIFEK